MNTLRSAVLLAACSGLLLAACDNSTKPPKPLPSRPGGQVAGPKAAPGSTGSTGAAPVTPAPTGTTPAKPAETKPPESKPAETKPPETKPAPAAPTGATGSTGSSGATQPPVATPPKPSSPSSEPPVLKREETNSGLIIEDLRYGSGEVVKPHDTVTVHYRGTFAVSGQTFDSSYDRNEPFTASLDRFVKGWQEGIPGMKVGSRRRLIVPPELGYGSKDVKMGNVVIPANSMLVFDLEILATKR